MEPDVKQKNFIGSLILKMLAFVMPPFCNFEIPELLKFSKFLPISASLNTIWGEHVRSFHALISWIIRWINVYKDTILQTHKFVRWHIIIGIKPLRFCQLSRVVSLILVLKESWISYESCNDLFNCLVKIKQNV